MNLKWQNIPTGLEGSEAEYRMTKTQTKGGKQFSSLSGKGEEAAAPRVIQSLHS